MTLVIDLRFLPKILALEARLDELQGEKHQLFLQLKKV
jgi:hypothetical protein